MRKQVGCHVRGDERHRNILVEGRTCDLVVHASLAVVMAHHMRDNGDSQSDASVQNELPTALLLLPVRRGEDRKKTHEKQ
jgi:hypothetical protein